jgi:hypothetical protein
VSNNTLPACDYAVAFVDLLGQKNAMKQRHLPEDQAEALKVIKNSVGKIIGTQKNFQRFFDSFTLKDSFYSLLPPALQNDLPDMAPGELRWQCFSDGFVIYIPLGNGLVKSPASSIFGMLMAAGCHCLIGLAAKSPVRIGIDVAWAVEYRPGELYGPAIAFSHHLESKVAQWPRVVVGDGLIDYLHHYIETAPNDMSGKTRKSMSEICLGLIETDTDGIKILDYLGQNYRRAAGGAMKPEVEMKAKEFISEQLSHWHQLGNKKLEDRYLEVSHYFHSHVVSP